MRVNLPSLKPRPKSDFLTIENGIPKVFEQDLHFLLHLQEMQTHANDLRRLTSSEDFEQARQRLQDKFAEEVQDFVKKWGPK